MKKIVFLLLALFSTYEINGQSRLDRALTNLEENYIQEKIYLLYDKNEYIAGEEIAFKAFIFNGYQPSQLSTTLFVELYDLDKKLILKRTLSITKGETEGNISLKEDLKEDVYFVRAYTPWMSNFPSNFEYLHPVKVYNTNSPLKLSQENIDSWKIKAVPESGNLVANIDSKVAVRLITEGNPPTKWSGYLINTDKPSEKITTFNNLDENVAVFNFKPQENVKYQVIVEDQKGNKQTSDLSITKKIGVVLHTSISNDGIKYSLKSSGLTTGLQNYKIVGTINNLLAYKAVIKNNHTEASSTIPANINNGENMVLQLAIFDENDTFVTNRLVFLDSKDTNIEQPEIKEKSLDINPRSQNTFEVAANPKFNNLTVVVRDHEVNDKNFNQNNILTSLWLTEDFKTAIYNPNQYFTKEFNAEALDAIMMSETWERFNWQNVLNGHAPQIKYKPQDHLAYKARLTVNGQPLPHTSVNLITSTKEGDSEALQFDTNDNAEFILDRLNFNEPVTISYFLNTLGQKTKVDNLSLFLKPLVESTPFTGEFPKVPYTLKAGTSAPQNKSIANAITSQKNKVTLKKNEILIEEVKIKAKKQDLKEKLNRELSSGMFSSLNSTIFDFVNENQNAATYTNIMQWLQGRVAGLQIQMKDGGYVPMIRNSQAKIYLDEMLVDPSMISSLSVTDIAMVKVIKGGGSLVGDAVVIYTRKGNMESANTPKESSSSNKIMLNGYNKSSIYEQPDYSNSAYKQIKNDAREVLYWNPSLMNDQYEIPKVMFYNNDYAKKFDVIIIGFSEEGDILYYNQNMN